jgi:Ni/Co efflux regulator RcnB
MKRVILAVLLAAVAATSFAASFPNDQYRNTAGEQDQHQPKDGS